MKTQGRFSPDIFEGEDAVLRELVGDDGRVLDPLQAAQHIPKVLAKINKAKNKTEQGEEEEEEEERVGVRKGV